MGTEAAHRQAGGAQQGSEGTEENTQEGGREEAARTVKRARAARRIVLRSATDGRGRGGGRERRGICGEQSR